jgi:methyl-accepting chemotaxis protein
MRRSWTVRQQLAVGFALPILLIISLGSFSYRTSRQQIETARWVAHTHEVIAKITNLLSSLKDAETGQRGFIITGSEVFLEPHRGAVRVLGHEIEALRALTRDNAQQQARLTVLQPLIEGRLGALEEPITVRRRDGFEAAAKVVTAGEGKRTMDEIRRITGEMIAQEQELLRERRAQAEQATSWHTSVVTGGTPLVILLVLLAALVIVRALDRRIGVSVHSLQSASSQLQAAAVLQAKGAKGQAAASGEAAATMHELVATSRQITGSAQRVMQVAGETAAAAQSGERTVQSAQAAIETVQRQVNRIVDHMLDLGRRSQDIGAILDLINELSEQTNILAINATIEAASAGDAGRRFAVIADEIRRLADRVGSSTKDIRGLIEEVRAAANTSVIATEDGAKAADACALQFGEMTASFGQIARSVTSTVDASREIELSTRQQSTAVEQASAAIGEVAATAREAEVASGQMLDTAVQLGAIASQLTQLIRRAAPA